MVLSFRDSWWGEANCLGTDPEVFFPTWDDRWGTNVRYARRICEPCVIRDWCLRYALRQVDLYGIWGGTTQRERHRLGAVFTQGLPSSPAQRRRLAEERRQAQEGAV